MAINNAYKFDRPSESDRDFSPAELITWIEEHNAPYDEPVRLSPLERKTICRALHSLIQEIVA